MEVLLIGFVVGLLTVFGFIMLIEKSSPLVKKLLIGHYVLTDIIGTAIAYLFLPVVGLVTLVSAGSFCLFFTMYLQYQRNTIDHITIMQLLRKRF